MIKSVCLAQQVKRPVKDEQTPTFTIVERAPVLLAQHEGIWNALKTAGHEHRVIVDKTPEAPFTATITGIDVLSQSELKQVIKDARDEALATESAGPCLLSKELDPCFDIQLEWLKLRVVLSQAGRGQKSKRLKRVFLVIG